MVRGGHFDRFHFQQAHRDAAFRELPGRFASGKPRADYGNRVHSSLSVVSPVAFADFRVVVFFAAVF